LGADLTAVIPAAGKGTRMASLTGGGPKELLKLGRKTVLERVIEEAREAEVDRIVVVGSADKPTLTDAARGLGAEVVFQVGPLGLADAIASANVSDEALVLYGDCAYHGGSPSYRMAELVRRAIPGCIAVEPVSDEETRLYGIVEVDETTGGIKRILEKPGPDQTSSRWAIAARFAFGPPLMAFLSEFVTRWDFTSGRELSMTPVFNAAIEAGFDLKAVPIQPGQRRVDCGSPEEYAEARRLDWD
jgi:UTP-glucose-1-phosphate uridylyltransferase